MVAAVVVVDGAVIVEGERRLQDAASVGVVALGEEVERTAGERLRVEPPVELDAADLHLIGAAELAVAGDRREQFAVLEVLEQLVEAGDLEVEALDGRAAQAEVEVVTDLVG